MVEGGSSVRSMGLAQRNGPSGSLIIRRILRVTCEMIYPCEVRWGFEQTIREISQESAMRLPITALDACTEEQLDQAFAALLSHATEKVLSDAEVQEFWLVYQEMQRRRGAVA